MQGMRDTNFPYIAGCALMNRKFIQRALYTVRETDTTLRALLAPSVGPVSISNSIQ